MLFAVDIDGTIAARSMSKFLQVCNEQLALGLSAETLQRRMLYRDFLALPEIAYRKEEPEFKRTLAWIDLDPVVLVAMLPLPGSVLGMTQLAQRASVSYYTARYSIHRPERNLPMEQTTKEWLSLRQFPCPDTVIFCAGVPDKLTRLAVVAQTQTVVLIDDQYEKVLNAFNFMDDKQAKEILQEHFQLVAFGARSLPEQTFGLQVSILPSRRAFLRFYVISVSLRKSPLAMPESSELSELPIASLLRRLRNTTIDIARRIDGLIGHLEDTRGYAEITLIFRRGQ